MPCRIKPRLRVGANSATTVLPQTHSLSADGNTSTGTITAARPLV